MGSRVSENGARTEPRRSGRHLTTKAARFCNKAAKFCNKVAKPITVKLAALAALVVKE